MDTIFALSTAPGKAGVAIVRISGPAAWDAVQRLCGRVPPVRRATLSRLCDDDGAQLDEAVILVFEEDRSFTGEKVAELHLHGSPAVVAAVMDVLAGWDGFRHAEPGEFTRRALENGRLDLAQVEGLADLIESETEAQRRQAFRVLSGELGERSKGWRSKLVRAAALLEATIDFAEEDLPVDVWPEVRALVEETRNEIGKEIQGVGIAERIRAGFEVAIVGAPNVGKSTLLNCLAGREVAITSEIAGTTRDVIEVRLDLGGLPVTLLDTAGLRDTEDAIERIGVDLARKRAVAADLRVFLLEPGDEPEPVPEEDDIVLLAKSDVHGCRMNSISGKTGQGVDALISRLGEVLRARSAGVGVATRARHREALQRGHGALSRGLAFLDDGESNVEMAAEELRSAIWALDSLIGKVDIEGILDEIFSSFCIGK